MPPPERFVKCACQHCGGHIEVPSHGLGQTIRCPHCGWPTLLSRSKTAPAASVVAVGRASWKQIFRTAAIGVCVLAAASIVIFHNFSPKISPAPPLPPAPPGKPTNEMVVPAPPPKPKPPPDLWHGLMPGEVTLDKPGDGRLVYAIGTLTNDTPRQRFGVKVELEVQDEQHNKLGTATDYTDVIEPGKAWKFRAMVTAKTAAAAKLTKVKEQE
jgi:hypothetical protein